MNKHRTPYNFLNTSLQQAITALDKAEEIYQASIKVNFGTTNKHREQRNIALDIRTGAILRLLSAIRKEFINE
ncbi:MAG: hypothetical protein BroJett025_02800 [Patescibacteria group bacterium]|nr:MAG: hypothetical protein BroJett025_02800 [Patescibacteria group bacterium]